MSHFNEISAFFEAIPLLTRNVIVATLVLSLSAQFGIVSPAQLLLIPSQVFKFQFWRLFTSMCLSSGFALLMHLYFMHSWLSSLESQTYRGRKGYDIPSDLRDFFMMLMFIMLSLSIIGMAMQIQVLTTSFSMAIVYIWSCLNATQTVQFMFGLQFKAVMLPWVFIGMDVIQGASPIPGVIGIIVGHSYHFLENIYPSTHGGSRLFITPGFVKDAFDPLDPREMTTTSQGYSSQQGRSSSQRPNNGNITFSGKGHRLGS